MKREREREEREKEREERFVNAFIQSKNKI